MDEYILDRKENKLLGASGGFYRTTMMGNIVKTEYYSEPDHNLIVIHFDNGKYVKVWTYKTNEIMAYENPFTRKISAPATILCATYGDFFLNGFKQTL